MKKIISLLTLFSLLACTGEKDLPDVGYIRVFAKYDAGEAGPEGRAFLFDLDDIFVDNYDVHVFGEYIYILDVNGERVYPLYINDLTVQKDESTGKYINKSKASFYPLSGDNKGRKFIIGIDLNSSPYSYTSKVITWENDKVEMEKIFKSESDEIGKHYEAW